MAATSYLNEQIMRLLCGRAAEEVQRTHREQREERTATTDGRQRSILPYGNPSLHLAYLL
eukprot:scaffold883_cov145-Skeletonema_menzelii.AAC.5